MTKRYLNNLEARACLVIDHLSGLSALEIFPGFNHEKGRERAWSEVPEERRLKILSYAQKTNSLIYEISHIATKPSCKHTVWTARFLYLEHTLIEGESIPDIRPQKPNIIGQFFKETRWLSNFHECTIAYNGLKYPSNEHAYQAQKSEDHNVQIEISKLAKPGQARKMGQIIDIRKNWDIDKFQVMLEINREKYKDPELKQKLLDTGDSILIKGNNWNDVYWGVYDRYGENNLGIILMAIRMEIENDGYSDIQNN